MNKRIAVMGMMAAASVIIAVFIFTHPNPGRAQYSAFAVVDKAQTVPGPAFDEKRVTLTGEWKSAFATQPQSVAGSHVTQRITHEHDETLIERLLKKIRKPT